MIDANVAKLIYDDSRIREYRAAQPSIEQRRLTASQKASEQYHREAIVIFQKLVSVRRLRCSRVTQLSVNAVTKSYYNRKYKILII